MCDNPAAHNLGRQEPKGCRYIYGDPATEDWRFCQRTIAPGGRPGDANKPPYCAWHVKVVLEKHTEARRRAYQKFLDRVAQSDEGVMYDGRSAFWGLIPVDMYVKGFNTGAAEELQKHD